MAVLAVLAFIVAEITAISIVASYLGALPTLGLLFLGAAVGSWLIRREGARTLRAANEAFQLRRATDRDLTDGLFRIAAGLLIAVPGFLTTLLGVACLLPPTRAGLRAALRRRSRRYLAAHPGAAPHIPGQPASAPPAPGGRQFSGDVVDGAVIEGTVVNERDHG